MIIEYLEKFGEAKRVDIDQLLLDKLPDVLDKKQKDNKVKNPLKSLKNNGLIETKGKIWLMSKQQ